jgi:hypothetical protein
MKKTDKVWVVAMVLFWSSFVATFLIDYLGIIETSNLGFVETLWISWVMWTMILGLAVAVLTRFIIKE